MFYFYFFIERNSFLHYGHMGFVYVQPLALHQHTYLYKAVLLF